MILITGATDGIGLETARQLARSGHDLILHGRNADKVQHAAEIVRQTAPEVTPLCIDSDLADLSSVARMAHQLGSRIPQLDVLINNAGVYMTERKFSRDGFEMTLAVNHIAHFLLASLLLPLLKKSSDPRVVTVSSMAHQSGNIDFNNLNGERSFNAYQSYATSKLANALFARELARRDPWLASNSLHPGVINTKLLHAGFSMTGAPVTEGARTSAFLAVSPEIKGVSGKYLDNCAVTLPSPLVEDEQLAQRLWQWTERAVHPWLQQGDAS